MPYIPQEQRDNLQLQTAGQLNYAFALLIRQYLNLHIHNYQTFNDIIGALEGQKLEVYRRLIAPYESKKLQENGEVY